MNRKIFGTAWLAVLVLVPATVLVAQDTATEKSIDYKKVINDYIEATGGKEAHQALKTLSSEGSISIPQAGIEGSMTGAQTDDKAYMKMSMAGIGDTIVGYNGEVLWQISEMTGPEIITGERKQQLIRELRLSPYLNVEEQYDSIECTGVEEFAGQQCYVVVMNNEGQEPIYSYFSVDNSLLVGNRMTQVGPMGKMEVVSKISEYKEVDGVKMAHNTTVELPQGMEMVTEMEKITVNGEVDKSLFELPPEIKELVKVQEEKKSGDDK